MTTHTLTARQVKTLQGLFYSPTAISATERGDFELMDLVRHGYAYAFGEGGCIWWKISAHGLGYLTSTRQAPSTSDDLGL